MPVAHELARLGLIILGITSSLTILAATTIGMSVIFKQSERDNEIVWEAMRSRTVIRMGTIFGLVTTAGILALSGTMTEGTMALLSGIAGYVLGGIPKPEDRSNGKD